MEERSVTKIVERELKGLELTESESQMLHGDLDKWKQELVVKLQDIERQFTSRRADSIQKSTREARIEYELWRKSAIGRKLAIVSRLQDINLLRKNRNVLEHEQGDAVLSNILSELKQIKVLLEQKL
jgi:hypothetical protein